MSNKEKNRRQMPSIAGVIDQFRDVFGDIKVIRACEAGPEGFVHVGHYEPEELEILRAEKTHDH